MWQGFAFVGKALVVFYNIELAVWSGEGNGDQFADRGAGFVDCVAPGCETVPDARVLMDKGRVELMLVEPIVRFYGLFADLVVVERRTKLCEIVCEHCFGAVSILQDSNLEVIVGSDVVNRHSVSIACKGSAERSKSCLVLQLTITS